MTPKRSPAHLAFIRSLPCVASGRTFQVEAAHVGSHGMAQKCSDFETIPEGLKHSVSLLKDRVREILTEEILEQVQQRVNR